MKLRLVEEPVKLNKSETIREAAHEFVAANIESARIEGLEELDARWEARQWYPYLWAAVNNTAGLKGKVAVSRRGDVLYFVRRG